jgi:hypothetical protein
MSRRNARTNYTQGQRAGLKELRQIVAEDRSQLNIEETFRRDWDDSLCVRIRLNTEELTVHEGGMPVSAKYEKLIIRIDPGFPMRPPEALVEHKRFVGYPHVLQGQRLCVYLDASREWHPDHAMRRFLKRLWNWFVSATSGSFDADTAMYHPVGGVLHKTPGTPTVVVRDRFVPGHRAILHATLSARTSQRLDITAWRLRPAADHVALVVVLDNHLVYGAGHTVVEVLQAVTDTGHIEADPLAVALAQTAARNQAGTPQYLLVAAPDRRGGDRYHLIAGRIPVDLADNWRREVRKHGPLINQLTNQIPNNKQLEWCTVSDERPEVITRRDSNRPMSAFNDLAVEIWGCGGLGSWIAEFIARAGAKKITLRDGGDIGGGLLVRQNYLEDDVGANKAAKLADRLRLISDDLTVIAHSRQVPYGMDLAFPDCDVLIDATVSNTVAVFLDELVKADASARQPVIGQVATDIFTATLGLLIVRTPGSQHTLTRMDFDAGYEVSSRADLRAYATMWRDPEPGEELVPARGCSVPTFHGSAADMAATAAALLNLLARHIGSEQSGTHLVSLPHATDGAPSHVFMAARSV